jgi:hypothetical protein
MSPDTVPTIYLKLAWLELNAVGTFTIGTLAVLVMVWFIATILEDMTGGTCSA